MLLMFFITGGGGSTMRGMGFAGPETRGASPVALTKDTRVCRKV